MKSFEIFCVKNNKIFFLYWFDIIVIVIKLLGNKMNVRNGKSWDGICKIEI